MRGFPRFPKVLISVSLVLTAITQACASDVHQPQSTPPIGGKAATIPFDLYQGYFIVARGSIGGLKNLNFFIDTGTSSSVLDSRIARKLKLHSEEPANVIAVGGKVPGEWANLPSVGLGPMQRSNLEVVTADLSFFEKFLPVRIDAIVGVDMLGQSPFVIDYSARVIRFGLAPAWPDSVPLRLDAGFAVFDAEIDHKPVHLLLDTGASSLVMFTAITPNNPDIKGAEIRSIEPTGEFESKQVLLQSLQLGPEEFRKKRALVTRNPEPSQIDFDGLMSPVALGISRISVDLNRGVMTFSR
ncbi:exported hypothetical protein [Candidatus Sulfotelmatomonas gaucii]|uniref:Peptidase A2 domain-containing protein n=1 Tax=Candidatus Sulfuritelmatomonas gaucii TaxID=2043161 RepID=A0A2N9LNW9_9BACT|nr:exported hypothetical protein [Candidatus Sulfotelmatomonas gaucii]